MIGQMIETAFLVGGAFSILFLFVNVGTALDNKIKEYSWKKQRAKFLAEHPEYHPKPPGYWAV